MGEDGRLARLTLPSISGTKVVCWFGARRSGQEQTQSACALAADASAADAPAEAATDTLFGQLLQRCLLLHAEGTHHLRLGTNCSLLCAARPVRAVRMRFGVGPRKNADGDEVEASHRYGSLEAKMSCTSTESRELTF